MLFVFPRATTGGFWMKNTLVPLTIVFFDSSGKARSQALDDTVSQGLVQDLQAGEDVPLRARAARVRPPAGEALGPLAELKRLTLAAD